MKKEVNIIFLLIIFLLVPTASRAGYFSFDIPDKIPTDSYINFSELLDAPAGKHGHANAEGEKFVFQDGKEAKFWGVDLWEASCLPPKDKAEEIADRYAAFGINMVRMHGFLGSYSPNGLLDESRNKTTIFDEEMLSRLDYFIAQLKENGIYVNFNLLVKKYFTKEDGVESADALASLDIAGKPASLFNKRMIELQKETARKLLKHYNPYTQTTYKEDPAIAIIELANENSVFDHWRKGSLDETSEAKLPQYYLDELDDLWNEFLEEKYSSPQNAINDWGASEEPRVVSEEMNDWHSIIVSPAKINESKTGEWRFDINSSPLDPWYARAEIITPVRKGTKYRLEFEAKSDQEQPMKINAIMDNEPWSNLGMEEYIALGKDYIKYKIDFEANQDYKEAGLRLNFGNLSGEIYIKDLNLSVISKPKIDENEYSLGFNFKRPEFIFRNSYQRGRVADLIDLYAHIEKDYTKEMSNYLRSLGYQGLISGLNGYYGLVSPYAGAEGDFVNNHGYFDHPGWNDDEYWNTKSFKMNNESIFDLPEKNPILRFGINRKPDKPMMVTEWNSNHFNEYDYELPFLIPIYASFLRWNGAFAHEAGYASSGREAPDFFSIYNNPQKMSFLGIGSFIYLNGLLNETADTKITNIGTEDVLKEQLNIDDINTYAYPDHMNISPYSALAQKTYISFKEGVSKSGRTIDDKDNITSQKGQIEYSNQNRLVSVENDVLSAVMGDIKNGHNNHYLEIRNTKEEGVVIMVGLDGKELFTSNEILIYAVSRANNSGGGCDKIRENGDWDRYHCDADQLPVRIDSLRASLDIDNIPAGMDVYSLDEQGRIKDKIDQHNYEFEFPQDTLWCLISGNTEGGGTPIEKDNEVGDIRGDVELIFGNDLGLKTNDHIDLNGDNELSEQGTSYINYFVEHGTPATNRLGAGERAGVVNSFRSAFSHFPKSEEEWEDVIKIATGHWPDQRSDSSEEEAKTEFRKIYLRDANMANPYDNAAVTVIAYGLRPDDRNLESEYISAKIFENIYNHPPSSARDWDVVRAIAYSGASR